MVVIIYVVHICFTYVCLVHDHMGAAAHHGQYIQDMHVQCATNWWNVQYAEAARCEPSTLVYLLYAPVACSSSE